MENNIKIKEILKSHDMTLTRFARKINISRPTLNSYITIYESGEKISKDKIQIGFDWLFKNSNITTSEFYKELDKFGMMLKREELLGMDDFNIDDSDILMQLFLTMVNDFKTEDCNRDIYNFIKIIVNGYRKLDVLKDLTNYFLIINLNKSLDTLDINEQYKMAVYYRFFKQFKTNAHLNLSAEKAELSDLKERIVVLEKERDEREKSLKNKLEDFLKKKIADEANKGNDISKLSELSVEDLFLHLNK